MESVGLYTKNHSSASEKVPSYKWPQQSFEWAIDNNKSTNKQIHLVGERFILKIHQSKNNYSYTVDVSVSVRNRNVDNVRTIGHF